jgi:hypothetical protein
MCPCPCVLFNVSFSMCPFPCVNFHVSISMCPCPCVHVHVSKSMCPCPCVMSMCPRQSVYTVEKANLNCRASVNFLLPCQEGQPNWGGKIFIHAIGGTFSW